MSSQTVLGFDFGLHHIGVATGSTLLKLASPLKALKAQNGIVNSNDLDKLFKDYDPAYIVVGMPLNMDGSMQDMSYKARKFGNRLSNNYKIKVVFHDERLSSVEAKDTIFTKKGFKGLKVKDNVDAQAACVILQAHFDGLCDE